MDNSPTNWLKGCGIGCGLIFLLSIIVSFTSISLLMKPFNGAIDARKDLDERYGTQESYRPPLDGVVAADRLEAFLEIRRALMPNCEGLQSTFSQFERMDSLGNRQDVPKGTMFREVTKVVGTAFSLPGKIGETASARNAALVENGMGLGEYTYIYTTAYYGWLGNEPLDSKITIDEEKVSVRVRTVLRGMIANQLEDLRAAPATPENEALSRSVLEELARLNEDHDRLPWQDGVPDAMGAAYDAYRSGFEATWCAAMAPFDLTTLQRKGKFSIQSD